METEYGAEVNFIRPTFTARGIPIPHFFYWSGDTNLTQDQVNDLFYNYSIKVKDRDPTIIGARYKAYLHKLTPNAYKHFLYEIQRNPQVKCCVNIPEAMAMSFVVGGKRTRYGAGLQGEPNKRIFKKITIDPKSLPSYKARMAQMAAQAASYARAKGGEIKGMDTALALNPVIDTTNDNGSIFVLNLIRAGTGSWNRIGRKVYPISCRIKGTCSAQAVIDPSGNLNANQLRCVLVWDKQPSGNAIPKFEEIFGTTDQAGTETTTYQNPLKYDNMDRFKVLHEWNVDFNPGNSGGSAVNDVTTVTYAMDEFYKFKGTDKYETVYSGNSSPMTIADISSGALYLVFRALTNNANRTIIINPDCYARLRYKD